MVIDNTGQRTGVLRGRCTVSAIQRYIIFTLWLECRNGTGNIPVGVPVLVPAKKLRKFSRVGKKKKVHTPSGIRTHDHCSTSPDPSPLDHPARRCWLPFFAKFIHLKPIILTLVNNRSPKPKPLELVNNRSPKPKPFVNNRLPKPNPPRY